MPSRRPGTSGRAATGVLLVLASTLLALVAGETYLRLFHPVRYHAPPVHTREKRAGGLGDLAHQASSTPGLSYELKPDVRITHKGTLVETNSLGMRDDEPKPAGPDLVRVAAIGDSFTFGLDVPGNRTYPAVLEGMLDSLLAVDGRTADVLNFGVVGYSSRDEEIVLRTKALPLDPDVVVIGYVHNDPETDSNDPIHRFFFRPKPWERSELLRLIASAWDEWESRGLDKSMGYIREVNSHPGKWKSVVKAMHAMADEAGDRHVPVILLIFPIRPGRSWDDYPYADLHERIAKLGEECGMRVIDLLPTYEAYPPARVLAGDGHPSVLGHQLAARAVFDVIAADPATFLPRRSGR